MRLRPLAATLLSAALLLPGTSSALSLPDTSDCLTWTDPKNDAATGAAQTGAATYDADLDIVGVRLEADATDFLAQVKVADLNATGQPKVGIGDRFVVRFVVAGRTVLLTASRDAVGATKSVAWTVDAVAKTPKPVVTYDDKADTVTAVIAVSDLREQTGVVAGDRVAGLYADAKGIFPTPGGTVQHTVDAAGAPDFYAYTFGQACGQPQVDPPLGTPEPGCNIVADKKGDGVPSLEPPAEFSNDPDLDILDVVGRTTAHDILVYIKIDKLAALPKEGQGHAFEIGFKANGKDVAADVSELNSTWSQVFTGRPRVYLAGTVKTDSVPVRVRFDRAQSMIVFALDRRAIAAFAADPLAPGTEITNLYADSYLVVGSGWWTADEAPDTKSADVVYAIGNNRCFPPPPAKIVDITSVTTQFGDAAAVAAKLTDEAGAPLAGKRVKFAVGTDSTTATTDAAGIARGQLVTSKVAGVYSLAVSFAGDATARAVSGTAPFTVVTEVTKLTLGVAKSGTTRIVTATLKDDDGKTIGAQKVEWLVNGKKIATGTTDSAGRVVLRTAKPTQVVTARFAAVAGKYTASSVSVKV